MWTRKKQTGQKPTAQQETTQQETNLTQLVINSPLSDSDAEAVRRQAETYAKIRNRDARHNEREGVTDPNVGWVQIDRSLKSAEDRLLELPEPQLQDFINALVNTAREIVGQKDKPTIRKVAEKLPKEHGVPSIGESHPDDTPYRNIVRKIRRYYRRPRATWNWFLIHNKIIDG